MRPTLGSTAPIKPTAVKTVTVHPGPVRIAALSPLPSGSRKLSAGAGHRQPGQRDHHRHRQKRSPPPLGAAPGILGVLPVNDAEAGQGRDGLNRHAKRRNVPPRPPPTCRCRRQNPPPRRAAAG